MGVTLYAQCLGALNQDSACRETYELAISKSEELMNESTMTLDLRRGYAQYLDSKGRIFAADKQIAEMTDELKDFMLADAAEEREVEAERLAA